MPICENCGFDYPEIAHLEYFTGKKKNNRTYLPIMQKCPKCGHKQQTGETEVA